MVVRSIILFVCLALCTGKTTSKPPSGGLSGPIGAVPTGDPALATLTSPDPQTDPPPKQPAPGPGGVFDITKFKAKPDGKTDNALAIIRAWNAACKSTGPTPTKLLIPPGKFLAGEIVLVGPCTAPKPVTIEIQGTLIGDTDISLYTQGTWISIEHVDGLVVTGGGTLNGQGEASWKYAGCKGGNCGSSSASRLPVTLTLSGVCNALVTNINFVNAKGFHFKVTSQSSNVRVNNIRITAPGDSPNTDGIHVSKSQKVNITDSVIGTGDDCISIGDGNTDVFVSKITCGPGHGISIGSLGKRETELDLKNVIITNCTLINTTNGARIKTYRESPKLVATGITFEDIVMNGVENPIIIDQNYNSERRKGGSNVKLSDIHFRNIRGTTDSFIGVDLNCSNAFPCQGVELVDVNLAFTGDKTKDTFKSVCANTRPVYNGRLNPPACAS